MARIPLEGWRTRTLALPQLFADSRAAADKLVEPKIRHITLEGATLRTPEDVAAWIDRTKQDLLNQVKQGPVRDSMNSEFIVKSPLSPILRKQLERAIVGARDVAETGARVALTALAVHEREPYRHMSLEQRALRKSLRAHGRQLGDRRHADTGSQGIDNLVHECAYEHWHSMLFARFLAGKPFPHRANTGIAVALEECEELAQEEGLDTWTLATRYAHRMLPQVFRPNHPAFEVQLAREHRLKLEQPS